MTPRGNLGLCCVHIAQLRGTLALCCVYIAHLMTHPAS